LRQAAIALLAAPVSRAARVGAVTRRSTLARVSIAVGLSFVLGVGVLGAGQPATAIATHPHPIHPLSQSAFATTFSTDRDLSAAVTIGFATPMDRASVAAALKVQPARTVDLSWDTTGMILTVSPRGHWSAATLNTVTVQAGALTSSGEPLARPARTVFMTRARASTTITPTAQLGPRVALDTTFLVSFSRPVDLETLQGAIRLDPPTPGTVRTITRFEGLSRFEFVPSAPLRPDVDYRLVVSGVADTDGLPLEQAAVAVHTTTAPSVVRFRPVANSTRIARDAVLSVRFTQAMDRVSTARAFSISVGGKSFAGSVHWAESDTVLVFDPKAALPYGAKVSMDVAAGAKNTEGLPLAKAAHAIFHTARRGVIPVLDLGGGDPITGGGAVGGGSWAAVETYYLGLMNCTRTGGWVTSSGTCSSPGGRNVAPLRLDAGISSKVSRPYAKRMAISGACSHFIGGNPGDRLRRAGFSSYRWAENIGCRSGGARAAVLGSHLFFQSEKSYNGGHYVNLMNPAYTRVGIGVWVSGGRVRLVVDFYHP
jgi:hypothetical protein